MILKPATIVLYMILNSKEGLTVDIVLCSVHYEQVNAICCLFLNKTILFCFIFFKFNFFYYYTLAVEKKRRTTSSVSCWWRIF